VAAERMGLTPAAAGSAATDAGGATRRAMAARGAPRERRRPGRRR